MADAFQFAATYPAYGHLKVSFDSDLGELDLYGAYGTESTTLPAGWTVNASGLVVKDPS